MFQFLERSPERPGHKSCEVGAAGDSRAAVERLIGDVGLRPVYVGGLEQVGVVDAVASLWFALALGQRKGRHLAFNMLTP